MRLAVERANAPTRRPLGSYMVVLRPHCISRIPTAVQFHFLRETMNRIARLALSIAAFLLCASTGHGQWVSQRLRLQAGWNAVFLHVQPEPREPEAVFASLPPNTTVWGRNLRSSSVQFIQNAEELKPSDPDWLLYLHQPVDRAQVGFSTMHAVTGSRAYLVKVPVAADLTITGKPLLRRPGWAPDAPTLVGFDVSGTTPPTFGSFFEGSDAHRGNPIFRLGADGSWRQESNLSTLPMVANEAFWIRTRGASAYSGPLEISVDQADRLDFGTAVIEQRVRIRNTSTSDRTVLVEVLASAPPPVGTATHLGPVQLARWRAETTRQIYGWDVIRGETALGTLKAGEQLLLRLAIQRNLLAIPSKPVSDSSSLYQSLLRVTDGEKRFQVLVPVTAAYAGSPSRTLALAGAPASPSTAVAPGLWIGNALIDKVSEPASVSDPNLPTQATSEASFRLIIHVDSSGKARLLQQVYLMLQGGRKDEDGRVVEPAEMVLVAKDDLLSRFKGSAMRDGQVVGRRVSSVGFGFSDPIEMSGAFGSFSQPLTCTVTMDFDDPLNPYKHRYHPDHNNLSEDYKEIIPEAFGVARKVSLAFQEQDPFDSALATDGTQDAWGIYREQIEGVHRRPIFVEGKFRLHRVSSVAVLQGVQ